jgi:hypothetical protein
VALAGGGLEGRRPGEAAAWGRLPGGAGARVSGSEKNIRL